MINFDIFILFISFREQSGEVHKNKRAVRKIAQPVGQYFGAPCLIRTDHLMITSQVLYQMS
jgi:hypothetical protein